MKRLAILLLLLVLVPGIPSWAQQPEVAAGDANPLLKTWTTPFQVPPFEQIKPEHFLPAIKQALAEQRKEIDAIVNNPKPATFENTILALEGSGELLSKVQGVFGNLQSSETNPQLQQINREVTPLVSAARDEIRLNAGLFGRVKAVYEQRDKLGLTSIQKKLVKDTYKGYVRSGANLDAARKEQLKKVNAELSELSVKFGDNLLHDTNAYRLVVDKQEDLAGLPPSVVAAAAEAAKTAKMPGKWVFTLQAPSIWPFLSTPTSANCAGRSLRRTPRAATTATSGTTRRSSPASRRSASSAPTCSATRATPTSCSKRTWRRTRRAFTVCSTSCGRRRAPWRCARRPTCRRPSTRKAASSSWRPATGGITARRCARRATTWTSRRSAPTSSWTTC
jgi:hypothetical protein